MASLALAASIVVLFVCFIGPTTYLLSRLNFPSIIVYPLSILSIISGIWFISIALPIWYLGLLPIYLGYISMGRNRKKNQG